MNVLTELYYKSCVELGLDVHPIREINGFKLQLGRKIYYFREGYIPLNDSASALLSFNKFTTNTLFAQSGVPVVRTQSITKKSYENETWSTEGVTYPLVAKPGFGTSCGRDVVCGIQSKEDLVRYLDKYFQRHDLINLEEFIPNLKSYRVLVLYNKVIGVVERTPAHVVGDGHSTLNELVEQANRIRAKKRTVGVPLGLIELNEETDFILKEKGIDLSYIPEEKELMPVRYICNSARGGTYVSLPSDSICKENIELAVKAAKAINLKFVGLDILCEDIHKPISQSKGFVLEANVNPDVRVHECAEEGVPCQVTKVIINKHLQFHPFIRIKKFIIQKYAYMLVGFVCFDLLWHLWGKFN